MATTSTPISELYQARSAGDWEAVARISRRMARAEPKEPAHRQNLFQALLALGRYRDAFAEGERWLDLKPARFDMTRCWPPGAFRPNLEALGALAASKAKTPWASFYEGLLRGGVENLARCESHVDYPARRYGWLACVLGRHYLVQNRFAAAVRWLEKGLRRKPFDWRALAALAEAQLCLGNDGAAGKCVDAAVAHAPAGIERGDALAWRGAIGLWRGRYRPALQDLEEAVSLRAQYAYCWRGAAALLLGKPEEAARLLEEAGRLRPGDNEIFVWRGEAHRLLGRHAQALEDLARVPDWLWARVNRALTLAALKDGAGLEREFSALPAEMVSFVAKKEKILPSRKELVLRAALRLARGYRRNDYAQAVWMRGA